MRRLLQAPRCSRSFPQDRREIRLELHLSLKGTQQLTAQVYRQLRDAVLEGRVKSGEALPSTRDLARSLQVSRTTVVIAYERLRAAGSATADRHISKTGMPSPAAPWSRR